MQLINLSKLNDLLTQEQIKKLISEFNKLNNNNNNISKSWLQKKLVIDDNTALQVIDFCYKENIIYKELYVYCLTCGKVIKDNINLKDIEIDYSYCPFCETSLSDNWSIGVRFKLHRNLDFTLDQRINNTSIRAKPNSGPQDKKTNSNPRNKNNMDFFQTLKDIGDITGGTNYDYLYKPTKEEYEKMHELYNEVFLSELRDNKKTTKEKGDDFEDLIYYIFDRVEIFKCTKEMKIGENQIDVFIQVENKINNLLKEFSQGFLSQLGRYIIIECKNEENTVSGDYHIKLNAIADRIECGQGDRINKLRILAVKSEVPKTFYDESKRLHYSSGKQVALIDINGEDLRELALEKYNILDILEEKIMACKTENPKFKSLFR